MSRPHTNARALVAAVLRHARMIYHPVFRGGKRNGAMDAIRFHRKGRLRVKLIGQHPLNQLSSLPAALGLGTQRRHLYTAFLPIEMKPGLATFCQSLLSPPDGEARFRLLECAVFDRIGHQFVQSHREGLNCTGAQRNAFRSVERDGSVLPHTNGLRSQLDIDQFVEGNPAAFRAKEQPVCTENLFRVDDVTESLKLAE